jgi:hypothetical protein
MTAEILRMWVITREPRDLPGVAFAARLWEIGPGHSKPTPALLTGSDLDSIRACLPGGLYRLNRFDGDDPAIVEVWL